MDTSSMVDTAINTGRSISEFGLMAITAGFFLVLSAVLMVTCFRWFIRIINGMMNDQRETMRQLLEETKGQNTKLAEISEGLAPENQLRVKTISNVFFDLAIEKTCRIIKRVRTENHIADKEATKAKVVRLIKNIHDDRNSKFDSFTYMGKPLSSYTNPKWIEQVAEVVLLEIYNEFGENNGRAYTNVEAVYAKIRLDFYNAIMRSHI